MPGEQNRRSPLRLRGRLDQFAGRDRTPWNSRRKRESQQNGRKNQRQKNECQRNDPRLRRLPQLVRDQPAADAVAAAGADVAAAGASKLSLKPLPPLP